MNRTYSFRLNEFREGNIIYGFYYCDDKVLKYSKNGDMYLDILLKDKKSFLYAKIWNHVDHFNSKFKSNTPVAVKGRVIKYRDRLEVNILNINTANIELYARYGFN